MCGYRRLLRVTPHRVTSWQTKMLTYFSRFRQFLSHYEVTLHHLIPVFAGQILFWQLSSDIYILTYILRKCVVFDPVNEKQWGIFTCKSDDLKQPELYIQWRTPEKSGEILRFWRLVNGETSIATSPSEVWSTHLHSAYNSTHPFGWPGWNDLICTPT